MAGKRQHTYPPDQELAAMVEARGSKAVALELGIPVSTLRSHLHNQDLPTSMASTQAGAQTFTLENLPEGSGWTVESLLAQLGLDPAEWVVTSIKGRGGHWGNPQDPSSQVRLEVSAVPRKSQVMIPDLTDWTPPPKPRRRKAGKGPLKAVVISDHHAPRIEETFHQLFVAWLRENQPDLIEVNGDLLDFPTVGRHRTQEEYNHDVNVCLAAGLRVLRDYRAACPDAQIRLKRGNHDQRLEFYIHDNAKEALGVAPGGGEDAAGLEDRRPWHSLDRLLWLEALHIEYIPEHWEQAKSTLSPKLSVRHGFSTSPNAGKAMLDKLSGSTIQGHDHRLSLTCRTRHTEDPSDPLEVRLAMSGGCACQIPGGLGYATEPDWQNGAVEVDIYPDGDFYATPMIYVPGRLLTRGGRLEP